jgi:hypothetical protein
VKGLGKIRRKKKYIKENKREKGADIRMGRKDDNK